MIAENEFHAKVVKTKHLLTLILNLYTISVKTLFFYHLWS